MSSPYRSGYEQLIIRFHLQLLALSHNISPTKYTCRCDVCTLIASLLGQREPRPIPAISTIEAPTDTSRDTVRELICCFPVLMRPMDIDASLRVRMGWAEVPNAAIKLFWRKTN